MSDEQGYPAGCKRCADLESRLTCIDIWMARRQFVTHESATLRNVQGVVLGLEAVLAREQERSKALEAEIANLQERWACVKCGRTPDGGKSGELYVAICHSCHRCNSCADLTCTTCGGLDQTVLLLRHEQAHRKVLENALRNCLEDCIRYCYEGLYEAGIETSRVDLDPNIVAARAALEQSK